MNIFLLRRIPKNIFWLLALCMASLACATFIPSAPPGQPEAASNGLIAYLGTDGNIYTVDGSGQNPNAITEDAFHAASSDGNVKIYQSQTWSSNGRRLAFAQFSVMDGQALAHILIFDRDTGVTSEVFSSATETPIYLYWAPDGERLTFLTSVSGSTELNLRMAFLDGAESQVVDMGQPYYWVWSPDGQQILTHVGGAVLANPAAHLAILSPSGDILRTLDFSPDFFQAPAWSPDGERLMFGLQDDPQGSLVLVDRDGANLKALASYEAKIAFSWSPDGAYVATLSTPIQGGGFLGTLSVIDPQAPEPALAIVPDTVIAYFWSPDSRNIAYLVLNTGNGVDALMSTNSQSSPGLALNVLNVDSGLSHRLATFQPTRDFLTIIPFFDQYHHSDTIWSPDSSKLVYTSREANGEEGVWVVGVAGDEPSQHVAEGSIAFWSWK